MLSNVGKHFGTFTALRGISTEVVSGEFVCLLGRSGCGKSTLLRCIAGLESYEGTIEVEGVPVERPGQGTGIVFQEYALFPWLTVADNVGFGFRYRKDVRPEERNRRVSKALEDVGLGHVRRHYPRQLSGGMRQRVAVARAIVLNPRVLLMDEPFAALDAFTRESLQGLLLDLWLAQRQSILFVTHSIAECITLADRVVVIDSGAIVGDIRIPGRRPRDIGEPDLQVTYHHLENLVKGKA